MSLLPERGAGNLRLAGLLTVVLLTVALGCTTGSYTPPSVQPLPNSEVVEGSFDETWDRLVSYASASFFAIDNFEKASGLLTLSFGAGDAEEYIDCGQFQIKAPAAQFDGPYVRYVQDYQGAKLVGRMNLRVQERSANQTEVTVNARYVFSLPAGNRPAGDTFTFNSGGSDTQAVSGNVQGTSAERTCAATGFVEDAILSAIR